MPHPRIRPQTLDLFLAISQGAGLSIAAGLRPFVAALVAGVLAAAGIGADFDGTDWSFLASPAWIAVMAALAVAATITARSRLTIPPAVHAVAAMTIGALLFAASLSEEGYPAGPGLVAGAAVALLGFAAGHSLLSGASARLRARGDERPAAFVVVYADLMAALIAALALLVPPVSLVPLVLAAWALVARRRTAARKYEGLRILR